jgi:hypothetical protein
LRRRPTTPVPASPNAKTSREAAPGFSVLEVATSLVTSAEVVGQDLTDPIDRRLQRQAGHRELDRTEQPDLTGIGHRQRRRPLTDIDRDNDRRLRGSKLDWHDPPPKGTPEGHGSANARPSMRNLTRSLLAPSEVSVKDNDQVISTTDQAYGWRQTVPSCCPQAWRAHLEPNQRYSCADRRADRRAMAVTDLLRLTLSGSGAGERANKQTAARTDYGAVQPA